MCYLFRLNRQRRLVRLVRRFICQSAAFWRAAEMSAIHGNPLKSAAISLTRPREYVYLLHIEASVTNKWLAASHEPCEC